MGNLRKVDFHCDVLWKLLENPALTFNGGDQRNLDVTLPRLKQADSIFQTFAIYIPERMDKTMVPILQSIDLFYRKVLTHPEMAFIRTSRDILALRQQSGVIGAMLSLEGADGLQGDPAMVRILFALGVRAAGLTWNNANWAADGVLETRGGGLTKKGRAFVEECNRLGILLDVSHLSDRAFWDMLQVSTKPIIASHSNCRFLCPHPRNLEDDQIKALLAGGGLIGVTYVPQFVSSRVPAGIADVLRHVERICEFGGVSQLMFGSDFDGIDHHVEGLTHPGELHQLQDALLARYPEEVVKAFFETNALDFLAKHLPH
ncbi:dipeptidase [Paenibacillus sacheonensis]|uniref:Membrane dipeptidase n=1 Tax=Paenibacillus sacheonensis TaxID=742054 RepID=A0A7X4YMR9_9BACL|nr:dipeptidase [Paenibacillus sacheonensis]MBM7564691.1 membrane dipeptidase [Paenibacillus sacheonensis]NBC69247.1 membrane dipeptidase [Paenibacillus sacheonensis]